MQFKRRRLSAAHPFVNASAALALLFSASACSKAEKKVETPAESPKIAADIVLPAVWSTRALQGEVSSVGISGGSGALLAVAYKAGGMEMFNLEAESVGQPALFRLKALADGAATTIGGTGITLFPGVTREGELKGFVYGEGLIAPAQIDLPVEEARAIEGLCSGDAGSEGILQIAYWTTLNNRELRTGIISSAGEDLVWTPGETSNVDFAITSCTYTPAQLIASPRASSAVSLVREDFDGLLSIEGEEGLSISTDLGLTSTSIGIKDGITIKAPISIDALTAMGTMRSGGYPGGVIALAGEVEPGEHRIVFVDPSFLTLAD